MCRAMPALPFVPWKIFSATPPQKQIAEGIPLSPQGGELGKVSIFADYEVTETVHAFADKAGDNRILNGVLYLQAHYCATGSGADHQRHQYASPCQRGGCVCYVDDYRSDQLIDDVKMLTKGFYQFSGNFWERVGECYSEKKGRSTVHTLPSELFEAPFINQYLS